MKISGNSGFSPIHFGWPLWPKSGFQALDSYVDGSATIARGVDDDGIAYWFTDDAGAQEKLLIGVPDYLTGIRFFGDGFTFDENGATVRGTITGVEIIMEYPDNVHDGPRRLLIEDIHWTVKEINSNPAAFWAEIFEGNDLAVIDGSTYQAQIDLGDGDDHLILQNVMDRYGQPAVVDMGAGDDFVEISDEISAFGHLMPESLILGEGFDDLVIGSYHPGTNFIQDFSADEDRITFLNLDKDAKIIDNGGEGVTIANFHISGVSEEDVKLENGVLSGINGRDYERYVNDAEVTQHLHGTTSKDVFVLEGKRDDYRWHATDDGKGVVIWDVATETPDLLYDFEVLRFADVSLKLEDWPSFDGVLDIADETQYLQAEEWGETFLIDGEMHEYLWAPTEDKTGTVVWHRETGKHDILTDFAWIQFSDGKADLVQYPRAFAPVTHDQADVNEVLEAKNNRQVFEIDGYRDDYSWAKREDGEGILIWNSENADILINFDGIRFLDSYADLDLEPSWGDLPRPSDPTHVYDIPGENQYLRGETGDETFVIDAPIKGYAWSATQDKQGIVIWNDDGFDILMDFKAIRFNDALIQTDMIRGIRDDGTGLIVLDQADFTQYLHGDDTVDQFVISGNSEDYDWGATEDGSGLVIWNKETEIHDILTDFELVVFVDTMMNVEDMMG